MHKPGAIDLLCSVSTICTKAAQMIWFESLCLCTPYAFCVQVNDTVMLDIETGKVKDFVKFDLGNLAMATGGHNCGRVGTIVHKVREEAVFFVRFHVLVPKLCVLSCKPAAIYLQGTAHARCSSSPLQHITTEAYR